MQAQAPPTWAAGAAGGQGEEVARRQGDGQVLVEGQPAPEGAQQEEERAAQASSMEACRKVPAQRLLLNLQAAAIMVGASTHPAVLFWGCTAECAWHMHAGADARPTRPAPGSSGPSRAAVRIATSRSVTAAATRCVPYQEGRKSARPPEPRIGSSSTAGTGRGG